ncbi:OmpA family protein [Aequorivita echinoideorum]|uniref:OmpA family protein n=1 Tax=Aequorivita echinoideorum TaxID=1549647 RepID=A0ABS5S0L7_9FLAO|nr:OmpA family protein [Aequorivita echinoideorum]MBT0606695.1 OmpA family protein [Aequorivita echinoideorum]
MKKIILFIFTIISSHCFAQAELKKADRLLNSYAYTEAVGLYNNYFEKNKDASPETYLKAADANYFTNNMRQASMLYEKTYKANGTLEEPYLSRYVRSLRSVRDYEKADAIYLKYLKANQNEEEIQKYKSEAKAFNTLLKSEEPSRYTLTNLDINTKYSDFVNVIHGDEVIFSSSRPGAAKELYAWNEQPYLSQFSAQRNENGQLAEPSLYAQQISSNFHDATIAMVPNSNVVYFTSSAIKKNKLVLDEGQNNNFSIYKGVLENGKITGKETVFFAAAEYSTGHPSVSSDGKYLFFASDMPDGYGEADIYYSEIFEDGTLSTPKNAGEIINTSGNDYFPNLIDGELYFSSNGHVGFGGTDLYVSNFSEEKGFSELQNLGKVANSADDDFSIVFNEDRKSGYLSSNRAGGKGDDDMYYFIRKPLTCDQLIGGRVTDKLSKQQLDAVTVTAKDLENTILGTTQTDTNGLYELKIPCNTKVTLVANKDGFIEKSQITTTGDVDGTATEKVNFELRKIEDVIVKDDKGVEKIKLDAIYFDYNKWDITPQAAQVLDKAVDLFNELPNMRIKIESHTDSRGKNEYNLNLSDKRAKATQEYIYSKGIAKDRIESATGYGESRLLNKCADGVRCTDSEHDLNRRSDFIILTR